MTRAEEKEHEKNLVRNELSISILQTIQDFDSNEVEKYELTEQDVMLVLSKLLTRKLER